jgi:uncharacterized protein YqgV (UPF0045/DUF77 family)
VVSCQFSIYLLGSDALGETIEVAVAQLSALGLSPETGPMSTYVAGDERVVFEGLQCAFDAAAQQGAVVMTVTLSNACPLPEA